MFPVALYGTVATSVLSLVALTVNRYVLIVHPSWYSSVYRKPGMVPLQLAICWGIPYGLMVSQVVIKIKKIRFLKRTFFPASVRIGATFVRILGPTRV